MACRAIIAAVLLMVAVITGGGVAETAAVDCSTLILNMADCLSFVTSGSTVEKPEGTCCSGLKTVVRSGPQCLCEAFKNSASLGVTLNVTKASTLPSVCKVAAPPSARCALAVVPPASAPPGKAPAVAAGAPESSAGGNKAAPVAAPALVPGSSASSSVSVSAASFVIGLFLGLISWF